MSANIRRHQRVALRAPVRVAWLDRSGVSKFASARTLDLSEAGIRLELPEAIELRTMVGLQSERLGLAGSGSVRNCVRCGSKYLVGVEFNGKVRLKGEAAQALSESALPDQNAIHGELQVV